jgi:protein-S-isoprenylcysteine O-methyltransferase Ste14
MVMRIAILATFVRATWLLLEVPYLRRFKIKPVRDWDKHSARFWDVAGVIELAGMVFGFARIGHIETGADLIASLGLAFLFAGIIVRWTAVRTLGKYFTGTVMIRDDHQLIQSGLYRHVRRPAYKGALLAHLGLGLSFSNWISVSLSVVPFSVAALYRMRVEERALREAFGETYRNYSSVTKRLIPKLY